MFFGKKEEKGRLPDLPPLKSKLGVQPLIDSPHESVESNSLPSFPDSPLHNRFSQVAIKDAVATRSEDMREEFPTGESRTRTMEMEEWMPSDFKVQKVPDFRMREEKTFMPREPPPMIATSGPASSDVFVKIEKFHTARKTLKDVSDKLEEIDELIKKIRETKMREEQEISGWESDIAAVKTRLNDVVENIFEKA